MIKKISQTLRFWLTALIAQIKVSIEMTLKDRESIAYLISGGMVVFCMTFFAGIDLTASMIAVYTFICWDKYTRSLK